MIFFQTFYSSLIKNDFLNFCQHFWRILLVFQVRVRWSFVDYSQGAVAKDFQAGTCLLMYFQKNLFLYQQRPTYRNFRPYPVLCKTCKKVQLFSGNSPNEKKYSAGEMRRIPKEFGNFILPILCSDILHRSINSKNDIILCVKSKKK